MNILIVHKHAMLSGVTTFVHTLCLELMKRDIKSSLIIEDYSRSNDSLLENLSSVANIVTYDEAKYCTWDIILFNYNSSFREYNDLVSRKRKMFIHGLMEEDYKPHPDADEIFVFGERALELYERSSPPYKCTLIRNFVDPDRFFPDNINRGICRVLYLDVRCGNTIGNVVKAACANNMMSFTTVDHKNPILDIERIIKMSDVVIGYGRSAIEGICCGKPVIIFGINGGDGLIDIYNYKTIMRTNMSGWTSQVIPDPFTDERKCISRLTYELSRLRNDVEQEVLRGFYAGIAKEYMPDVHINKILEVN